MRGICIDYATLRDSHSILGNEGGTWSWTRFPRDFSLLALSQLVESIVLYDQIFVPQVPHVFSDNLLKKFEGVVSSAPINLTEYYEHEKEAIQWASKVSFEDALKICRLSLYTRSVGSDSFAVSALFGVEKPGENTRDMTPFALSVSFWWDKLRPILDISRARSIATKSEFVQGIEESLNELVTSVDLETRFMSMSGDQRSPASQSVAYYVYWLLHRARAYEKVTRDLDHPYMPHPARSLPVAASAAGDYLSVESTKSIPLGHYADAIVSVLNEGKKAASNVGLQFPVVRLPPVFQYVLSRIDTKDQLIVEAQEIASSRKAKRLRRHLAEIEEAVRTGDIRSAVKLADQTEKLKDSFRSHLGLLVESQEVRVGVFGIGTKFNLPTGQLNTLSRSAGSGDLVLVRDVFAELSSMSRLGKMYELLVHSDGRPVNERIDLPSEREIEEHLVFVFNKTVFWTDRKYEIYRLIRTVDDSLSPSDVIRIMRRAARRVAHGRI